MMKRKRKERKRTNREAPMEAQVHGDEEEFVLEKVRVLSPSTHRLLTALEQLRG